MRFGKNPKQTNFIEDEAYSFKYEILTARYLQILQFQTNSSKQEEISTKIGNPESETK